MSSQSNNIQQFPVYSHNLDNLDTPGVIVEVDPLTAEELGAFVETALSEEDAWISNIEGEELP